MASANDKIKKYINDAMDGIIEIKINIPDITIPHNIYLLAENIVSRGDDILGFWFVGSENAHVHRIKKVIHNLDELMVEFTNGITWELSYPYGKPVQDMAKDWRENGPHDIPYWINEMINEIKDEI